jgi:peptide/nickel transport system substrate-binding protein
MRNRFCYVILPLLVFVTVIGCNRQKHATDTVTMLIESSPTSLDPRIGIDAQSERIDMLMFDPLLHRDAHFNVAPWVAKSWNHPDPLTYIFHLTSGVRFQDGRPLSSADVKWTLDTMIKDQVPSVKAAAFRMVESVDAPDPVTLVLHLKHPDPALLGNLTEGAFGIVPAGSGRDFGAHPVGSGPFRFVSQEQDKEVVLERSPDSWQPMPAIPRIRLSVVPDDVTRALELQKGSADVCINALNADLVHTLESDPRLQVEFSPGTVLNYVSFNMRDPVLRDVRVRQAIAYAIDRRLIIHALWRDHAHVADSLLPSQHWAWTGDVQHYPFDPARANALLDAAGWKRDSSGVRFRLSMKTSTDGTSRLLALALQQQLRAVGIALEVRSFEFATFYADIAKGVFQLYTLRWVGGNEEPDIFRYANATASFPPHGANRGLYSNPEFDALVAEALNTGDDAVRRVDYVKMQQILARDLPAINLWYLDTVLVHDKRLGNLHPSSSGSYDFLRDATFTPSN